MESGERRVGRSLYCCSRGDWCGAFVSAGIPGSCGMTGVLFRVVHECVHGVFRSVHGAVGLLVWTGGSSRMQVRATLCSLPFSIVGG